ncbi:MAG: RsmB/NOP family class I SAM-dependent RNA methyltransferase [Verrucomicrobiota bacterium]
MTPSARIADRQSQHFLRLLAALRPYWRSDRNLPARLQRLFVANPAFGARDRRLYRELVFTAVRHLPWIEPLLDTQLDEAVRVTAWLAADTKDTSAFRAALATGEPPAGDPTDLLPAWFREHCPAAFAPAELATLNRRAPLWLRLQTDAPETVLAEFAGLGWKFSPSPVLPGTLRLDSDADVTKAEAYRTGQIEVQDLGSQMVLAAAPIASGGRWFDACAGAGGKTLQLARLLGPNGHVDAHDIRPAALAELQTRAHRAGLTNIRIVARPAQEGYHGVLVDAPCSGTGTWRRAPHLKWTTRPADIAAHATQQLALLLEFAPSVRPGGLLLYATCSLSRIENEHVFTAFLAAARGFAPVPLRERFGFPDDGLALTVLPARHDTDGFFVAAFRRDTG